MHPHYYPIIRSVSHIQHASAEQRQFVYCKYTSSTSHINMIMIPAALSLKT